MGLLAVEDDDMTHNIRPDLVEYVKLIDSLQQQLYAEREKNKHLKGA